MHGRVMALGLSVLGLLGACSYTPPAAPPKPSEKVIAQPLDQLWPRAVAFFANDNVPIQTIDKSSGLIVSQQLQLTSDQSKDWVDCGKGAFGPTSGSALITNMVTFNVFLRPMGDSTAVRVNMAVASHSNMGEYSQRQNCVSTGHFESALLASLVS